MSEQTIRESPAGGAEEVGKPAVTSVDDEEVSALAYRLWQERGCPEGSPQDDWFLAERELRGLGRSNGVGQ